ncbi:OmpA family protein [Rhodoferax sp. PAMC 29310]|uniref:OmpA family protein n=1 Tax=Rhodoferax sp. PAMC 29310 TaxID=2822760 RepID=UPI001B330DA3|nr:OmpA family protein [Rhodoferax sp. PAMC 29310]
MSSQRDDNQGVVFGILGAVVVLAVALAVGFGLGKKGDKVMPVTLPMKAAVSDAADGARVIVEGGVVKFYFASGNSDLAAGASEAVVDAISAVMAGKSLIVSGFHDSTGDAAKNAELAKQRAFGVRDLLQGLGVAADKVELMKPEETLADGDNAQARSVEVSIK